MKIIEEGQKANAPNPITTEIPMMAEQKTRTMRSGKTYKREVVIEMDSAD